MKKYIVELTVEINANSEDGALREAWKLEAYLDPQCYLNLISVKEVLT